jgi:hypothetical protein
MEKRKGMRCPVCGRRVKIAEPYILCVPVLYIGTKRICLKCGAVFYI